jgi:hypothetical protein
MEHYIGVAKKCCENCEKIIKALNTIKGTRIEFRGGSNELFTSQWPPFLETELDIKNEFLRLANSEGKSLQEVFYTGKIKYIPSTHMEYPTSSSPYKSSEKKEKYPLKFEKKANNYAEISDDFSSDSLEGETSQIIEDYNVKASPAGLLWKKNFNDANKLYHHGKRAYYVNEMKNAIGFFMDARDKYKAVLSSEGVDGDVIAKVTERLGHLKSPGKEGGSNDGKYSTATLKLVGPSS